jgi:hypothetical protein
MCGACVRKDGNVIVPFGITVACYMAGKSPRRGKYKQLDTQVYIRRKESIISLFPILAYYNQSLIP